MPDATAVNRERLAALYPFGYGLSYTSFHLGKATLHVAGDGTIRVSVPVTNTGKQAGAEVVQAYLTYPSSAGGPRQLKGFARIQLDPGKSGTATITIDQTALQIWDTASQAYVVPGSTYRVAVGTAASGRPVRSPLQHREGAAD